MPIRNIWSLEPGECIVAEELMKRIKCEVYFPMHDVGVDLLIVRENRHVGVQVKESRYYISRVWPSGHRGHSWHQVRKEKFQRNRGKVGFYIFLTYLPVHGEYKEVSHFENKFLIVPSEELEKRMMIKDAGKRKVYSFCFHFEDSNVWDERVMVRLDNELANYTRFLNAWRLIEHSSLTQGKSQIL